MINSAQTEITPPIWYKQFWPWFLIFFPATAVIAGIATIILAVQSDDGLVKDDYYKAGLAINQTLERNQYAQKLKLNADVTWDQLTQTLSLKLTGKLSKLPPRLTLQLAHTTQANHDQNVTLLLSPDNKSYTGRINKIRSGNWTVILEPKEKNWRITGRATLPQQSKWTLN